MCEGPGKRREHGATPENVKTLNEGWVRRI
jgi:hypothetical protein